jgi:hypothetical protein
MRPVLQSVPGPDGDCYAACVASILEVGLAEVPDLAAAGDRWAAVLRGWLGRRGMHVGFRPGDGRPLADQADPPQGYAITGQRVLDGSVHAVVCRDGRIVHDPSPRPIGHPLWPVVLWTLIEEIPLERIEPGSVAAFFAAHPDVKPLRYHFVEHRGKDRAVVGCCGASAALMAADEGACRRLDASSMTGCRLIGKTLGLTADYIYGFLLGWDGRDGSSLRDESTWGFDRGHEDGRMAYGETLCIRSLDP